MLFQMGALLKSETEKGWKSFMRGADGFNLRMIFITFGLILLSLWIVGNGLCFFFIFILFLFMFQDEFSLNFLVLFLSLCIILESKLLNLNLFNLLFRSIGGII